MLLHHPIALGDLAEAWVLDRLAPAPVRDDRPSLRFLRDLAEAGTEAEGLQAAARWPVMPGGEPAGGAVLSFERGWLASATRLISMRVDRSDLAEDERELRGRSDLRGVKANLASFRLADEEVDAALDCLRSGHPDDDGTGRWTAAVRAALREIYEDPRRIPPDLVPLPF